MLKLLKQNLIDTKKKYIIMYILTLSFFILLPFAMKLNQLLVQTPSSFASIIISLITGLIQVAFLIVAILVLKDSLSYIKDSLFSKGAYLNYTLPFKTKTIVLSKLLTSLIWIFIFCVCAFIGYSILLIEMNLLFPPQDQSITIFSIIKDIIHALSDVDSSQGLKVLRIILLTLIALLSIPYLIVIYLFSNILVNTSKIKKNKRNLSSLMFIILLILISQFFRVILLVIFVLIDATLPLMLLMILFVELAVIAICYQISMYLIKYKLELV